MGKFLVIFLSESQTAKAERGTFYLHANKYIKY